MAFTNGHAKAGGRKKGTPNISTSSVKAVLIETFDKMGGVSAFLKWARKKPDLFYAMYVKMLPTEVKAEIGGGLRVKIVEEIVGADDNEARSPSPSSS